MVYISAKLTMVMLAVVPPVSIGAVIYGRYLRKLSNQTQEALGDMSKVGLWMALPRERNEIDESLLDGRGETQRVQDRRGVQRADARGL